MHAVNTELFSTYVQQASIMSLQPSKYYHLTTRKTATLGDNSSPQNRGGNSTPWLFFSAQIFQVFLVFGTKNILKYP